MVEEKDFENYSYEKAIDELQDIIKNLETGNAGLDESLDMYQKGTILAKFCAKKLEEAENSIMILAENSDGKKTEKKFEPNNSDV